MIFSLKHNKSKRGLLCTEVIIMTSLLLLFLVFLLTLGITELLRTFASWIHIPMVTAGEEKILVLPLEGHQENIEYIIRSIIFDYSAHFPKCRLKIV